MLMMQECCKLFTGLFHLLLRKRYVISYCHTGNVTRMSWPRSSDDERPRISVASSSICDSADCVSNRSCPAKCRLALNLPDSADWKWLHVAPLSRAPCVFCAASLRGAHLLTFRLWEKQWKQSLPLFCNLLIVNLL